MAQVQAYLGFTDNCKEAMEFYQQMFGGNLEIMTVAQSPVAAQMPARLQDKVLHAALTSGALTLLGSDMVHDVTRSQSVTLALQCGSAEEAETYFHKLSAGGTVTHPLGPSFWGGSFGQLADRFGVYWMLKAGEAPSPHGSGQAQGA